MENEGCTYKIYNPLSCPVQINLQITDDTITLGIGVRHPNRLKARIRGLFSHKWTYVYTVTPTGNTVMSNLVCSRCRTLAAEEK